MRSLTFHGFLKHYLKQLSGVETESVSKLYKLSKSNPRLWAPLVLYIMTLPRQQGNHSAEKYPEISKEIERIFPSLGTEHELLQYLATEKAPPEYRKTYSSYLAKRDRMRTEQELKSLIREQVLELRQNSTVSDYRAYKDLGINPGNYNAFLRQGDVTKLSLANAKRVLEYFEKCDVEVSRPSRSDYYLTTML